MGQGNTKPSKPRRVVRRHTVGNFHERNSSELYIRTDNLHAEPFAASPSTEDSGCAGVYSPPKLTPHQSSFFPLSAGADQRRPAQSGSSPTQSPPASTRGCDPGWNPVFASVLESAQCDEYKHHRSYGNVGDASRTAVAQSTYSLYNRGISNAPIGSHDGGWRRGPRRSTLSQAFSMNFHRSAQVTSMLSLSSSQTHLSSGLAIPIKPQSGILQTRSLPEGAGRQRYERHPGTTSLYMEHWPSVSQMDDGLVERADVIHDIVRYIIKRNYLAPISRPRAILDLGTSNRVWLKEVALEFPKARVVSCGITQPEQLKGAPKNVTFQQIDVAEGLPFSDGSFDYVHQRMVASMVPSLAWRYICSELYRVCRSGGWVEVVELHQRLRNRGPCGERLDTLLGAVAARRGVELDNVAHLHAELQVAGFIDITQRVVSLPVGDWGGASGTLMRRVYETHVRSLADEVATLDDNPVDGTQYDLLVDNFLEETEHRQTSLDLYYFYARRS
ncbi:hypothetical protein THASP1DRAFT_30832 [Thamnocephalis sphaerospora]|uniref:Methyltransferase domain-containing protein n=1 Tax=Thamnocephalis sphaerospora TaxID=78915 RepID=A0A4P9XPI8_9FUNG|nr:hypothetical protein THASP1DRAFT_30832 [Thamnocephalis sphaerospora]|eukprot:RKP07351.1 hypothetical protein THASP1DRAFT_30832 [Thamnocephalis sphaerospora]